MIKPGELVPNFTVGIAGGGSWSPDTPRDGRFLVLIGYRGYHCPVCKSYLPKFSRLLPEFTKLGVDLLAVSSDTEERAVKTQQEWNIDNLSLGYGLTIEDARKLGLFISRRTKESDPEMFTEPGLFIINPDNTLYASSIQSMPFTRPDPQELIGALKFIIKNNYPHRGEA